MQRENGKYSVIPYHIMLCVSWGEGGMKGERGGTPSVGRWGGISYSFRLPRVRSDAEPC